MKLWKVSGGAAVAALVLAGCGSGSTDTVPASSSTGTTATTAAKKKDIKIAMIAKESANPVFQASKTGAEAAAAELGKANGINIKIDWLTPPTADAQRQAQIIAQAVNDGADYVLISCSDASKVTGAINDAVAKGVPVMTFDSDDPGSKRFAFYGADDTAVGTQLMDEMEALSPSQPLVIGILAGNQNAPNLQKRSAGVIEEAKKFKNVKIVGTFNHLETAQDATQEVIKDNGAHPEINAWVMIGGWPLFSKSLLSLDPARYKIVAVDGLPVELPYVEKGIAPVLLAQPVYDWGYKSVQIIVDKMNGKDVPAINKMELTKVTKDTLGTWAEQLEKWGFKDVDPKYLPAKK